MKSTLRVDNQERCNVSSAAEENRRMRRTVVNARGQVTIPAELRKQLGIKPGTRVTWFEEKGRLILAPTTTRRVKDIRGFLKPKPGESSAFEESLKERARERRREDLKAAQYDTKFEKKMAKAEKIMRRYHNTLRALAK
jgi:antitoxin PrlF